jgi:hypothetical protein
VTATLVAVIWLLAVLAAVGSHLFHVKRLRAMRRHEDEAIALTKAVTHHPSRPIGPEDEHRWKEWSTR